MSFGNLNQTQEKILRLAIFENVTSLRESSRRLGVNENFLKVNRSRMYRRIGAKNLAHAVALVTRGDDLILPDLRRPKHTAGDLDSPRFRRLLVRRRLQMKHTLKMNVCRFVCDLFAREKRQATLRDIMDHFEVELSLAREVVRLLEQDGFIETTEDGLFPLWRP